MKSFFVYLALFTALFFAVSCSSGSKKDDVDTGDTVTDEDRADSDQTDMEPSEDAEPSEKPDNDESDTTAEAGDDDADTTPEDGDDDADQAELDDDEQPMKEAIYFGIIGFNEFQYTEGIGLLDESTESSYKNFVDALVLREGTALYFADYTALKMMHDYKMPPNLKNVALVTFTDGLDNISLANDDYNPEHYGSQAEYRDAIHEMITSEEIHGLNVTAYTIGLKGADVTDEVTFEETLKRLSSSDDNVFQVYNMGEALLYFKDIAANLYSVSQAVNIDVEVPGGYDEGQVLRFTFDEPTSAADSNLYIEAIYRRTNDGRSLDEITYHGLAEGQTTIGSISSEEAYYHFVFEDLKYDDSNNTSLLDKDIKRIMLWKKTSNGGWDRETEFDPESSTVVTEDKSSALIMLVLDCTTSLGADFTRMKEATKDFITILLNGNTEIKRISECTDLPENAEWNTVSKISQTWSGSEWLPAATGTYSEEASETECRYKCTKGAFRDGSVCKKIVPLGRICTGHTKCYNNKNAEIECPAVGEDFYGQDAQYLDKCVAQNFTVETPVEGENVVFDHNTGLIWQQSPSSGTYTWDEALNYCETLSYAGYSDWRLPDQMDFHTIWDNSGCQPALDTTYFQNINNRPFWTSQEYGGNQAYYALFYYVNDPGVTITGKTNKFNVMCVRGSKLPTASFTSETINGSVVFKDSTTGLMWQRYLNSNKITWLEALRYCLYQGGYAGYSDWRLPSKNELLSLMNYEKAASPHSDLPNMPRDATFWSSTTFVAHQDVNGAWRANFGLGDEGSWPKNNKDSVICVRNY